MRRRTKNRLSYAAVLLAQGMVATVVLIVILGWPLVLFGHFLGIFPP